MTEANHIANHNKILEMLQNMPDDMKQYISFAPKFSSNKNYFISFIENLETDGDKLQIIPYTYVYSIRYREEGLANTKNHGDIYRVGGTPIKCLHMAHVLFYNYNNIIYRIDVEENNTVFTVKGVNINI
jgi:hypothetical protein